MNNFKLGYNALRLEIWLSQAMLVMPAINLLFADIGMSQTMIGVSQAVFTAVALTVNIPTGWLADRYSRRFANAIGDAIAASGLAVYALADSFAGVILAEALLAIGMGASMGAASALVKGYCQVMGKNYTKEMSHIKMIGPLFMVGGSVVGGWLMQFGLRTGFWVMVAVFLLGACLSLLTRDLLPNHNPETHPLRDIFNISRYSLSHKHLSSRIYALALLSNSTHVLVFMTTPLFLANGVSVSGLGVAWGGWQLSSTLGSWMSKKRQDMSASQRLKLAYYLVMFGYVALLALPSPYSLSGFILLGLGLGWGRASFEPVLLEVANPSLSSTVLSVANTAKQLMYVPLVVLVNWLAGMSLAVALLFNLVFFGALGLLALMYQARNP